MFGLGNYTVKKLFKRDVERVELFLEFLIGCCERRYNLIKKGELVDLSDANTNEKLKFISFVEELEIKIHLRRLFDNKKGGKDSFGSIEFSLSEINFGNEELMNNELKEEVYEEGEFTSETMGFHLLDEIDNFKKYLSEIESKTHKEYLERERQSLNRENYLYIED